MGYVRTEDLVAKDFGQATPEMALKRTIDLIEYIRRAAPEKVYLNDVIRGTGETTAVHNCGSAGCVAGHALMRYAPVSLRITPNGCLRDPRGRGIDEWRLANDLLRQDLTFVDVEGRLFSGGPDGEAGKEIALARLRAHRDSLKELVHA
jgi:hypothetical protein